MIKVGRFTLTYTLLKESMMLSCCFNLKPEPRLVLICPALK